LPTKTTSKSYNIKPTLQKRKRPRITAVGWGSGLGSAFKTVTPPTLKITVTQKLKELLNAERYTFKPTLSCNNFLNN
jgi:hypothetical protein